jgi:tripartite-type tricarboxylate transporter receptor subunit TctC
MMFDAISTIVSHTRAGKLRSMGTTGKSRSAVTPEAPTVSEAGVPGYEATIWLGLMAPAGTPRAVVERVNAEMTKILNAPDVKENWSKQGAVPMGMSPDEFGRFLREDVQKWSKLVKDTGMKVD